MTLHEIEETVQTLSSRHKRLDEAMLVTLLRAGGWEEKDIEEGKLAFRHLSKTALTEAPLALQEHVSVALPPEIDANHFLPEHAEPEKAPEIIIKESLIAPIAPQTTKDDKEDLPHNLPLRPFETSEHIWPFSRYKDVFFGSDEIPKPELPSSQPSPVAEVSVREESTVETPRPVVVFQKPEEPQMPPAPPVAHIAPAKLSKGDEKLVITAAIMLLLVLMLLGYMYQNGRL